ncbi:hypothetical protein OM076_28480 [Solirubrobacter ginsenosidimutans]|uniref:Uncharacterized protein n=1 Tax=Solirubrobacter ginsenosidimutans TaxID=490573 RepID=A0A9X3MWJ6_9ACTN|nr:hypothetical protein [Solirubrobacter ginsenosidimutans]MDA0164241.1 hypothetical protein [Solirubrobacter ginsenosidimutans]
MTAGPPTPRRSRTATTSEETPDADVPHDAEAPPADPNEEETTVDLVATTINFAPTRG